MMCLRAMIDKVGKDKKTKREQGRKEGIEYTCEDLEAAQLREGKQ